MRRPVLCATAWVPTANPSQHEPRHRYSKGNQMRNDVDSFSEDQLESAFEWLQRMTRKHERRFGPRPADAFSRRKWEKRFQRRLQQDQSGEFQLHWPALQALYKRKGVS